MESDNRMLSGIRSRDEENVRALLSAASAVHSLTSIEDLLARALESALQITRGRRGLVFLASGSHELHIAAARGGTGQPQSLDLGYCSIGVERVWTSGAPVVVVDSSASHLDATSKSMLQLNLRSMMAVPMEARGSRIGVLYVDSNSSESRFTAGDLEFLVAIGKLFAVAVDDMRLIAGEISRERMMRDLELARRIQTNMLPPALPVVPGIDVAAMIRPFEETCGDYYDVLLPSPDRMVVIVADISGHGLGAALLMISFRASLRALLLGNPSLEDLVRQLNLSLNNDLTEGQFVSAVVVFIDAKQRSIQYVNAGHTDPLILRRHGETVTLSRNSPILGVFHDLPVRVSESIPLHSGDTLFLWTDGVYELSDASGEMYGEDRLVASARSRAASVESARGILEGVMEDQSRFVGDRSPRDDQTVVVVRATGRS